MELTEDVRLIVRPVFNLVNSASLPNGRGGWDRDTNALGDTQLALALSPAKKEAAGWFWGVGATFNFPTSTLDSLGTEKWAVGPSATVWHFGDPWIFGVFAQSLFSFAGDSDRESINILDTQVFALYQIPDTQWKVGMTPNITYDFKTEQWNVPVGLGATTIVKLFDKIPTRILFEVQYYLEQDDNFGPEWNFRFLFAPIVPKPKAFQKPLLG
ncbi:MAG: transporter [Planctomycetota bacterium]|nr:transporter [Planctomycetota bacterium]